MHSEDKKVINKNEEQKLISNENKYLETVIDGVEYGVTDNGCIYYKTQKGKAIIVCNFFMQLLSINDDLTDNKSYTFKIVLQDGKAQKEVVLNNYNLKNNKWIDALGMEYHLGKYAKYKDLKTYISNLIVENMSISNEELIKDTITKINSINKIDTNKDYTLGKSFLLGLSRLLEADNNEYIASSRYKINMSDSSKMLGFIEFDNSKEIYYLKMDKIIKKLKNFNDIFNENLKLKLNNNKVIYSQLADLGVLIVNRKDGKYSATQLISINNTIDSKKVSKDNKVRPIRFFKLDNSKLKEIVKEYIRENEVLESEDYNNIFDEITTIYPLLSENQIQDILDELVKEKFNVRSLDRIESTHDKKILRNIKFYKKGFYEAIQNQDIDISNMVKNFMSNFKISSNPDVGVIDEKIEFYVNKEYRDIQDEYQEAGFIQGLKICIKQEIAQKQIEEINNKLKNKDISTNNYVDEICKKFSI